MFVLITVVYVKTLRGPTCDVTCTFFMAQTTGIPANSVNRARYVIGCIIYDVTYTICWDACAQSGGHRAYFSISDYNADCLLKPSFRMKP